MNRKFLITIAIIVVIIIVAVLLVVQNLQRQTEWQNDQSESEPNWLTYINEEIGLRFSYPEYWGNPTGFLVDASQSQRGESGFKMDLHFRDSQGNIIEDAIVGGGRSVDYVARRGRYYADYKGFQGKTAQELCEIYQDKDQCKVINEDIISVLHVPVYENDCPPAPETRISFAKQIFINLPENRPLSGFTLIDSIISEEIYDSLINTMGGMDNCYNPNPQAKDKFNRMVDDILIRMENRTIDSETLKKLDQINKFEKSIKILE